VVNAEGEEEADDEGDFAQEGSCRIAVWSVLLQSVGKSFGGGPVSRLYEGKLTAVRPH
jgi:hypothetical protein